MNEVELLSGLRAGLPAARPEVRAAARAGLMARIEHSARAPRHSTAVPWWRRPRVGLAAAGVCLAALLIALPIGIFGGSGKVPIAGWSLLVPSERQVWISFDGSRQGRVREVVGKPRFVSADQRADWVVARPPPLPRAGRVEDSTLSSGGMLDASELSTDPAELRHQIEAREIRGVQGPPGEAETFTLIGDMLRETYLPSDVRAALYELTAELPGVELLGEVEDPVGRPGTGIAFTDRKFGIRHELIFDPATSTLLGEKHSIVRSGAYGVKAPPAP